MEVKQKSSEDSIPKMLFWLFNINQMLNLVLLLAVLNSRYHFFYFPNFLINQSTQNIVFDLFEFFIIRFCYLFVILGPMKAFSSFSFCLTVFFFLNSFWSFQVFFFLKAREETTKAISTQFSFSNDVKSLYLSSLTPQPDKFFKNRFWQFLVVKLYSY